MLGVEMSGLNELVAILGAHRVQRAVPLAPYTTFKIGGPADLFYTAHSADELAQAVLAARDCAVPYFVLGAGANILVGDCGIRGLVVRNRANRVDLSPEGRLRAESGAIVGDLIALAIDRRLSGLEHYAGIPSSVGGALWQNLHFLGPDRNRTVYVGECLIGARILTQEGAFQDVNADYFQFGYDDSILHHRADLVLDATFQLAPAGREGVAAVAEANLEWRRARHPSLSAFPSAGSVFKKIEGVGAGRLIEQCGLKGLIHGGAQVSPRHANFIVNLGGATARDVLTLAERCQSQVQDRFGYHLQMEIGRAGDF